MAKGQVEAKYFHNRADRDITIAWDGEDQVFKAMSITTLHFQPEESRSLTEHYVNMGAGDIVEVSAGEAQKLTSGRTGRAEAKSAKVAAKDEPKTGEQTKEGDTGGDDEGEVDAKPKGKTEGSKK